MIERLIAEKKAREAISVMKKAYDTYNANAQRCIDKDDDMHWYWSGMAEGTRRSWELLEKMLGDQHGKNDDPTNRVL